MMSWIYADVEKEYEINKNLKKEDVDHLQQWIKKQPHLPPVHGNNFADLEMIFFLRSCLYNVEKAKVTIDNYFTLKVFSDVFIKLDVERMKVVMRGSQYVLLPKLLPDGSQILYLKTTADSSEYDYFEHMWYVDNICKLLLGRKGSIEGLVSILNLESYGFGHLSKIPLGGLRKYLTYLQEALPVRLMGIHFINSGSIIEKIFALAKPMLKKELFDMMHVHKDKSETLYKYVPLDFLPDELGGKGGVISELHEQQNELLLKSVDILKVDEERVADESKRIHKSKLNYMFGVDGCFKKLEID
ncbi:hypothetical protein FQR65_LT11326 [Abscondita terminalis]|nr:hypothetical protein FQR65_LT11326 [Abscondita terminalis]